MIANKTTGSSFGRLIYYATDPEKADWMEPVNLGSQAPGDIIGEMEHVAGKSRATQPVYHLSISWDMYDNPSRAEMLAVGADFLGHMGFEGHQALLVSHIDTDHPHLHLIVNRVNPDTGKAVDLWEWDGDGPSRTLVATDYERIETFLRQTEKTYGWRPTPGKHAYEWNKEFDGRRPAPWEIKQEEAAAEQAARLWAGRVDGRAVIVRAQELKDELFDATDFRAFDNTLAENGLWIESKGQGAVITDGGYSVKASSVSRYFSKGNLEDTFGQSLTSYLAEREVRVEDIDGERIVGDWINLRQEAILEEVSDAAYQDKSAMKGYINQLETYDTTLRTAQQAVMNGFIATYEDPKGSYRRFKDDLETRGYEAAVGELLTEPSTFGETRGNARGSAYNLSESIEELSELQSRYYNHIVGMSSSEYQQAVHRSQQQISGLERIGDHANRQLRAHLTKGLSQTEGGRAARSSVETVISVSRAAKDPKQIHQAILRPAKGALGKGKSEIDRAADEAVLKGGGKVVKLTKSIANIAIDPKKGATKRLKQTLTSAIREASEIGKQAGRGF